VGAKRAVALVGIEQHGAIIRRRARRRWPFSDIESGAAPGCTLAAVTVLNTRSDFVDHVVETMRELGPVTAKAMFGGWGLYHEGLFFALIHEDTLYLKVDEENTAQFEAARLQPFVYHTKDGDPMTLSYRQAPPEALESPAAMAGWARLGYAAALRAKNRKPSRKRKN
jgi:DNA transformation protein